MPPDSIHYMTHVNQLTWNGKAETLGELVANVEHDYTLSNPQVDCTVIGVLQILQKIGVKNVALSNALMKWLSDNSLAYNYATVQRAAENWMQRQERNESRKISHTRGRHRDNSSGPTSCWRNY